MGMEESKGGEINGEGCMDECMYEEGIRDGCYIILKHLHTYSPSKYYCLRNQDQTTKKLALTRMC